MSIQKTPLQTGKYYHIYNRGINSCDLFREDGNYEHFMRLYHKYISPVANTFAWVLMKNHFHFLVQILPKDRWDINPEGFKNLRCLEGLDDDAETDKRINQQFSNLFNAYTKACNKRYDRTGSLFEHSFRRKHVDTMEYLKRVIVYIHMNPVKHGFCQYPEEYPWSSYLSCISFKPTKLQREKVIASFGNTDEFKIYHNQKFISESIDEWIDME
ncbi:MAG: hypothetical protein H6Q19_1553 [Bacteroidetes bacterium]|nr:hypothetical protein [Bacteroidota bacterium]